MENRYVSNFMVFNLQTYLQKKPKPHNFKNISSYTWQMPNKCHIEDFNSHCRHVFAGQATNISNLWNIDYAYVFLREEKERERERERDKLNQRAKSSKARVSAQSGYI